MELILSQLHRLPTLTNYVHLVSSDTCMTTFPKLFLEYVVFTNSTLIRI